jgi:adenylate cyclase
MSIGLRDIAATLEGLIPPAIVTCSSDGEPNITHLSQVQVIDDDHVALSNQFFGKTVANVSENPRACLLVMSLETGKRYSLAIEFERRDTSGPVFDELASRVDAVAAVMGMQDVFKLRSADIYRFLSCEHVL